MAASGLGQSTGHIAQLADFALQLTGIVHEFNASMLGYCMCTVFAVLQSLTSMCAHVPLQHGCVEALATLAPRASPFPPSLCKMHHRYDFELRIGINHGPIVAGVIGTDKMYYDIWGDTVRKFIPHVFCPHVCTPCLSHPPALIRQCVGSARSLHNSIFACTALAIDSGRTALITPFEVACWGLYGWLAALVVTVRGVPAPIFVAVSSQSLAALVVTVR